MGLPWLSSFDDGSSMIDIVKVNGSYMRERGRKIREVRREREREREWQWLLCMRGRKEHKDRMKRSRVEERKII